MTSLDILYEDNHLLVVNKPAGIATMGAESGPTIHSLAADYLKRAYNKPGKAFVGIVSRLDSMTSGVLVLTKTSKAAARLSKQFAAKSAEVTKVYLAAIDSPLPRDNGEWVDWVCKDDRAHRMRIVSESGDAKEARLRYVTIGGEQDYCVIAIQLLTGRKHQIRVQLADRGHPVIGDRKYGSERRFSLGVALHSWRLQLLHPTLRESMWFAADPPNSWKPFLRKIADDDQVWSDVKNQFGISQN